jgi:hypothetical protein
MKRREFIAGLGSAAAWPVVARAHARKSSHSCSDHCGDAGAKSGSTYYRFGRDW